MSGPPSSTVRGGLRVRLETAHGADFVLTATLEQAIDAGLARGVATFVFSGPSPHPDLLALVTRARAAAVEVDLHALSEVEARALREAGARRVRLLVDADRDRLERSMQALLSVGLEPIAALPIGGERPDPLAGALSVAALAPQARLELWASGGSSEADVARLGVQLEALAQALKKTNVELVVAPERPIPPCLVPLGDASRRLLVTQLRREGAVNTASPACATCALARRCGLGERELRAHGGAARARPIEDATPYLRPGRSPGSRLRVLGDADVTTFFHVDYDFAGDATPALPRDDAGEILPTSRIGIIYRCNQVCTFCELADMESYLSRERVRAAIDAAVARGSRRIILTGGEPTLSPDLEDYVAHCRARGVVRVELQTNAVLLDRGGRAQRLASAGLTHAQISLHGADPAVSDALTAAPGTHRRTLEGIDALLAAGVDCLLNHLIFRANVERLVDFVDFVDARWGAAFRPRITLQFHVPRNEFATREEAERHLVRYTELLPPLRRAIERAGALGLAVQALSDPTSLPSLCIRGGEGQPGATLHAWESEWMARAPACARCAVRARCPGIPRRYLELFGPDEFVPFESD